MNAKVKWTGGLQFVGESGSNHAVVLDADPAHGGSTGMTPMEMLLIAVAGCTGMDVASILQKKRQHVTDIEVRVSGAQAEDYPKKYTSIAIEYIVTGREVSDVAVQKAIESSMDKYCSVKATVEGTAKITHSYKIVNE
jgi:putative redox protein